MLLGYGARAVSLDDEVRAELGTLEAGWLLRAPRVVEGAVGARLVVDGVEVVNFASNDYLGLASDRRITAAAHAALEHHGMGAGSSRLIAGNGPEHVGLEAEIAEWMRSPAARLFNTGYAANVGVLTTLLRDGDAVFSDQLNHASIIDGCRLSRADIVIYPHRDLAALERALATRTGGRKLVVSESVFSMDGDVADVEAMEALCRQFDAVWVLDEAHAIGVLGPEGRGLAAAYGVVPDVVIGTFGKALGTFGAFVSTSRSISDLLWNRARPFVFSTGLPPCIPAATRSALAIVRGTEGDERRRTVAARARELRRLLELPRVFDTSIVPIVIGSEHETLHIGAQLFDAQQFVATVRPPTVPVGTARLRVSLSAAHTIGQIQELTTITRRVMKMCT